MSTGEHELDSLVQTAEAEPSVPAKVKLALDVQIEDVGPCKKHVKVSIPRTDVEKQFADSLGEMTREAQVPGFRPGRAPKTLVEKRFRKQVANQVKSTLLMASLEQLDEDYKLNPISQPNLDVEAIELPDTGPMTFEIEVEVRPDFPTPNYKSLTVKRPIKTIEESDVDLQLKSFIERYAQLVPKLEGGAAIGDFITADMKFALVDGTELSEVKEVQLRLQPELRFQDGKVPGFGELLEGVRPGESRETDALIGSSSPDPNLRNKTIRATFVVQDLKTLRMPTVDESFLRGIGFDSLDDLRNGLRAVLERRLEFQKRDAIRRDILTQLIDQTPFDLPADLVGRQEKATLRRQVQELRQSGLSDEDIRAREAEIRANAHESTLASLKEFFILAKIAEEQDIKVDDADLDLEIEDMARRSDESVRRIRARVEKEGLGDTIATQILERKTIGKIIEFVTFEDVALAESSAIETIDESAGTSVSEPESPTEGVVEA